MSLHGSSEYFVLMDRLRFSETEFMIAVKYIFAFPFASKTKEKKTNSISTISQKKKKYWEIDYIGQKREKWQISCHFLCCVIIAVFYHSYTILLSNVTLHTRSLNLNVPLSKWYSTQFQSVNLLFCSSRCLWKDEPNDWWETTGNRQVCWNQNLPQNCLTVFFSLLHMRNNFSLSSLQEALRVVRAECESSGGSRTI